MIVNDEKSLIKEAKSLGIAIPELHQIFRFMRGYIRYCWLPKTVFHQYM